MVAALAPSAVAAPLYSSRNDCIDDTRAAAYAAVTSRSADEAEVRAVSETRAVAVRHEFAIAGAYARLRPVFGAAPLGDHPQRVYFAPRSDLDAPAEVSGLTASYCERGSVEAVVIAADVPADKLPATIVHELWHAFQSVPLRRLAWPSNWFLEATATWAEARYADPPYHSQGYDSTFLGRPQVPLDHFGGDLDARRHAHGAYRFLEWLAQQMPADAHAAMIQDAFRQIGEGHTATLAFRRALGLHQRNLRDDLPRFWAEMLGPTRFSNVAQMPQPRVETIDVSSSSTVALNARPLAADLVEIRLSPGVRQLQIEVEGLASDDTQLWARHGGALTRWRDGDAVLFCLGDPGSGGGIGWPPSNVLRLAFTNTSGQAVAVSVAADGADVDCDAWERDIALDRPRCVPPPYWRPPARFTDAIVFRQRFWRVLYEWHQWFRDIGYAPRGGTAPYVARWRRHALAAECTRMRLQLDHVPARFRPLLTHLEEKAADARRYYDGIARTCRWNEDAEQWWCRVRPSDINEQDRPIASVVYPALDRLMRDRGLRAELNRCQRLARASRHRHPCAGPPTPPWPVRRKWFEAPA